MRSAGHRSWQWPASCSKPAARATPKGSAHCKDPQDRLLIVRYACFVPVMAINKPDFLAGYLLFYESARYGGDFMAAIENNRNFTLSPTCFLFVDFWQQKKQLHCCNCLIFSGATGNRTRDTRIFSPLLYQLSYGTRFCLELPYLSIGIAKVDIIF